MMKTKLVVQLMREGCGRFAAWWAGLFGAAMMFGGNCPCCGSPSCPNGLLANGVVAGLAALGLQLWRRLKS